ncbi:MAG: hypothetical protein GF310_02030 [candidate division Zixibacteria bacterium]|nr:hypothetical protein [candidate division Zixibacteria bacterium]
MNKTFTPTLIAVFIIGFMLIVPHKADAEGPSKYHEFKAQNSAADTESGMAAVSSIPYLGSRGALTFAPTRQLYGDVVTKRDMWHNTATGRQIVYVGYYNAGCDYVYMNFPDYLTIGSNTLRYIKQGIFDWSGGTWDFTVGGLAITGIEPSYYPNLDAFPNNGYGVHCFHSLDESGPDYSWAGTAGACPSDMYNFVNDSLPGPPNTLAIQTGYCGDTDAEQTPYLWPHLDVDTAFDGTPIIHIAAAKHKCSYLQEQYIETRSLIYYRKVGSNPWEGPVFMDSAYLLSQIVRSDRNSSDVYYCYLKPMYYQTGNIHPCPGSTKYETVKYEISSEIVYQKSTDDGATWGPINYVTDYISGFEDGETDPAVYDLSAMVDPNGNLHIVWVSADRDPEDYCKTLYSSKMWHYDTGNDCISLAYDATHPAYFIGELGKYNNVATKPNISWCDDKLYISFMRFGANAAGDTSYEVGAGNPDTNVVYQSADIMVVGSDMAAGDMGKTWTDGINLSQTTVDSCLPGDCFHEVWPTMSMYSTDSLMLLYLEDKDPGMWYDRGEGLATDNPVMFMTWPCFTMADVGSNASLTVIPSDPTYPEIGLAPNGNTSGCTTPASFTTEVELHNSGNVGLNYTTSSNAGWLSVTLGASGPINAGAGPRYSSSPFWTGAPGCASPAVIEWTASSASLGHGNYSGTITVDIDDASIDDFDITVNLVVACEYYLPEYANIVGGCWFVDVWNTPGAGSEDQRPFTGNMSYYACGDDSSLHPLYKEALIVGWKSGSDIYCFTDYSDDAMGDLLPASMPEYQRRNARMRALSGVTVTDNTDPVAGTGYYQTEGYFCTPDSVLHGKTEYFVPLNQDTAIIIERITLWNESATTLTEAVIGEGIDWDVEKDSNFDAGGFDPARQMIFQYGAGAQSSIYAGLASYDGHDASFGGAVLACQDWIHPYNGYHILDIYDTMTNLDGSYIIFSDSNTDLNSVFRFWEGSLAPDDSLQFCKVKAVSLDGEIGLQELIDKGFAFIENYELCESLEPPCQGECGDANDDNAVNVSDAVWIINYVFISGAQPQPVLACGDANSDGAVNVSDAVWLINYVFIGGNAPYDCSPGSWDGLDGDCCEFSQGPGPGPNDPGLRDTVDVMNVEVVSDPGESIQFSVPVNIFFDETLVGLSLGFYYDSDDITIDSISTQGSLLDVMGVKNNVHPENNLAVIGYLSPHPGMYFLSPADSLLSTLWFTLEAGAPAQEIHIDSGFFPPAGDFILSDDNGESIVPYYTRATITVTSDIPPDSITTDPVFLISPGGHVPFRVYMCDGYGDPIVGDSTIHVELYNCDELIRCPGANPNNTIYPEAPSDDEGIISFYLDGGKCDLDCVAKVMRGRSEIAEVPVRMLDVNGDLIVSYNGDFGYSDCNDYNGNGEHDFEDQNIWTAHLGDSCAMDACDRFEAVLDIIPRFNIVEGQYVTLELALSNNNLEDCYIGLVSFFLDSMGTGGDPILFGSSVYNDTLAAGELDTILYEDNLPIDGPGTFTASFLTDCCAGVIEATRFYDPDSACIMDFNQCTTFRIALDSVPVFAIDTVMKRPNDDWPMYYEYKPSFPIYSSDSLVFSMCTPSSMEPLDYASLQTYIWYNAEKTSYDYVETYVFTPTISGDVNCDCTINVSDAVLLINYIFIGGSAPCHCIHGDTNCDGSVNISDAVVIINYVFLGSPTPCQMGTGPEPQCGKMPGYGKWYK